MLKTRIVLPDGTELFSGSGTENAIQSVVITQCVNAAEELTLGSCCANMVEVKLLTPKGAFTVAAGDELTVYRVAEDGTQYKVGLFTAEKPVRATANSMRITAYDRVTRLDRDMTQWLAGLDAWPYNLYDLASMVCRECGLVLENSQIPNGEYPVRRFSGDGITGRQLMQWIGQIAGRFCRATADGGIEFAWYTPVTTHNVGITPYDGNSVSCTDGHMVIASAAIKVTDEGPDRLAVDSELITVTDDGEGNVTLSLPPDEKTIMYYQNGLSFEDYDVSAIRKVQLRQNQEDVGTVYPDGITEPVNTYSITGNPMLTSSAADALLAVAQNLYEHLRGVTYTPCKVSIPANMIICPGHTVQITDRNGKTITAYVMKKTQSNQKDTLECTGSPCRDSVWAVNNQAHTSLNGKVLNLRTDVDGLKVENSNNSTRTSRLELDVEGIRGQVNAQNSETGALKEQVTQVEQTAREIRLSVESIQSDGVSKVRTGMGYTFDDNGLHIARDGQQMENLLDNTGMYVTRSGQTILQANNRGVVAVDVTVGNFLIVGSHARLENYSTGRTACFYLGG